ncbi:MAG TPA: hypothetical protein VKA27_15690 [Sunxiuqinia sp.]|nr:hypothetical protein [Sunxiuqinia sp.]
MNRFLIFLAIIFTSVSCSVQSKLNHQYKGETIETVKSNFPTIPYSKASLANGNTQYDFTKQERLASTTISQGDATLDPMHSPSVLKIEHYIFIIDKNNLVVSSKYEKDYKRLGR